MKIRYAVQFVNSRGNVSYHMQGLPNVPDHSDGFEFAVLYATIKHAQSATREFKLRSRITAIKKIGWKVFIVPVQCEIGQPVEI